ncbi:MAG: CinA family nicotinamide mononucleotide deamidase-related protein [Anaerolineales bacterium]|jgi:competence/damage-inducible protein CinA-like protein
MRAEIITIGTELLLGEIVDTNAAHLARALRDIGLDLFRTTTVGDNAERIAQVVAESLRRAPVVITTGGLGPTVGDATRQGIAQALGVQTEFRPELWDQIVERFASFGMQPTENNRRQAHIPIGAIPLENPVGTAPAFLAETEAGVVIALPGVPGEMKLLLETEVLPYLRRKFDLHHVIKTRILRTAGVGESWLDDSIQDLEQGSNPTIGLSAHAGRVDIRITAKAEDDAEADKLIGGLETTLRERLGGAIYGVDKETLEATVLDMLQDRSWRLVVLESGTQGALGQALSSFGDPFVGGRILPPGASESELEGEMARAQDQHQTQVGLAVGLRVQDGKHELVLILKTPEGDDRKQRSYAGPLANAPAWAVSLALNLLRRRLS